GDTVAKMEAAAGFEPAHNGFAVRSLNHLGTPPYRGRTHTYTTPLAGESAVEASCGGHALFFDTAYNAALLRAKILDVDVNFHTLRHTFASHDVMRGGPLVNCRAPRPREHPHDAGLRAPRSGLSERRDGHPRRQKALPALFLGHLERGQLRELLPCERHAQ